MKDKYLMESKSFIGILSKNSDAIELHFSVCVGISGEASISINRLPLNTSTKFISENYKKTGTRFEHFKLNGTSLDGTQFDCDNIIFTRLDTICSGDENSICPVASYSLAKMIMPCEETILPTLSWRIKGFQSYRSLATETDLGTVEMAGAIGADGKDEVSGYIKVSALNDSENLEDWYALADKLCDHILHAMSFAANADLGLSIIEFKNKDSIKIELYSRNKQQKSVWPTFNFLDLQGIFECAVRSYFKPAIEIKNLFFAIKWFNIHGSYIEANLISAMTVLENLIDSNLTERDGFLLGKKSHESLRRNLSTVVKEEVRKWTTDEKEQIKFIAELNNRFSDLKRRSFIEKLNLLAKRWGVQLDDIDENQIREAKSARDQVVHRGHYVPGPKVTRELHDHVLIVREIVVRFILTALNFEGNYCSYINGQHYHGFSKSSPDLDFHLQFTP